MVDFREVHRAAVLNLGLGRPSAAAMSEDRPGDGFETRCRSDPRIAFGDAGRIDGDGRTCPHVEIGQIAEFGIRVSASAVNRYAFGMLLSIDWGSVVA